MYLYSLLTKEESLQNELQSLSQLKEVEISYVAKANFFDQNVSTGAIVQPEQSEEE